MKTGWVITHIDERGLRIMMYPHTASNVCGTVEEADQKLADMLEKTDELTLRMIFGDITKIMIKEIECHDSGDPKRTVFGEA